MHKHESERGRTRKKKRKGERRRYFPRLSVQSGRENCLTFDTNACFLALFLAMRMRDRILSVKTYTKPATTTDEIVVCSLRERELL
jgi:hypothetical protein